MGNILLTHVGHLWNGTVFSKPLAIATTWSTSQHRSIGTEIWNYKLLV